MRRWTPHVNARVVVPDSEGPPFGWHRCRLPTIARTFRGAGSYGGTARFGEIEAAGVESRPYDRTRFRGALDEVRTMLGDPPEQSCRTLTRTWDRRGNG
jgi:hypothetical protein